MYVLELCDSHDDKLIIKVFVIIVMKIFIIMIIVNFQILKHIGVSV